MIHQFEKIKSQINSHRFGGDYHRRLRALETAIEFSMNYSTPGPLHLALSGGVDSSLLLAMLLSMKRQGIVAHTLGTSEDYPDVVHAKILAEAFPQAEYRHHIIPPYTGDAYFALYAALEGETDSIISGDVIDELAGGYYIHQQSEDKGEALYGELGCLKARHLNFMNEASTKYGIIVYLPYATAGVFEAMAAFRIDELVDNKERKMPIYDLAAKYGVPQAILDRRKMGLVSIEAQPPPGTPAEPKKEE